MSVRGSPSRTVRRWRVGYSATTVEIADDWLVLDAGSGGNPHPRANILLDRELGRTAHRSGGSAKLDERPFVLGDLAHLPFRDAACDYMITTHVAEHVDDPVAVRDEQVRVARRGYVETPSPLGEALLPEPAVHRWAIARRGNALVFRRPRRPVWLRPLSALLYAVFYMNAERTNRWTLRCRTGWFCHQLEFWVNVLVRAPWVRFRRWTYTCFEWQGGYGVVVETHAE